MTRKFNWLLWGFLWSLAWLFALAPFAHADDLTDAINAERAKYGLHALSHEPSLANESAVNNGHQRARGMGHFYLGSAQRQNAAWNQRTIPDVVAAWMFSAGHRAAILAIEVTHCGGAYDPETHYWTLNFARLPGVTHKEYKPAVPPQASPPVTRDEKTGTMGPQACPSPQPGCVAVRGGAARLRCGLFARFRCK